jgi:pre-mRNA-splicing factor ATP-dependent RNA helicase DHX38/PRP16
VWEATPRSDRGTPRDDAPSLRVPNVRWDATPRDRRDGDGGGWGGAGSRGWDAPTPRASRGGSPGEGNIELDMREWEEEQVRLDRDWYMGAEEGGLVGDDEHNPLAQYDDLTIAKQAEIAKRPAVRLLSMTAFRIQLTASIRKYPLNKLNTCVSCSVSFYVNMT